MRKITREAIIAFMNWYEFNKSNTQVYETQDKIFYLILHWNEIAKRYSETWEIKITNAWRDTNTTNERLNWIPWVMIYHKKWKLYLNSVEWNWEWITI